MFWRKRVIAIAEEYPDVELSHMYVDNAAMQLVRNPKQVIFFLNLKQVILVGVKCFKYDYRIIIFQYNLFLNKMINKVLCI